ncbi:helix-turn-helix domain-containing protein [Allorhizocola rhizosphaerae]|uniref:nSTAND1 domain-containing NTPase n=1 Tax=Allorhizocola rhizosphaerae TaxID=1872709 RepID=UPI000E3D7002|nr:helix-turn-helix domain-containing protein [Allorhizocola rhizosphaerae]
MSDGVPEMATRMEFAAALSALRVRAGLTVRDVAKSTGLQASTLGGYFSGRHLPPMKPPDALARILHACGISDPVLVGQWEDALRQVRRLPGPRPASAPVPYRGLASFQAEDAEWFFGREALAKELVERVGPDGGAEFGMLLVVGPSGAGKSSLLRAGLLAALEPGECVLFTPGPHPVHAMTEALAAASHRPCVLIVDQFEEIFTACTDDAERDAFIAAICSPGPRSVVLGLRADFYGRLLSHPELVRVAQKQQIVVGPMSEAELRTVIEQPARKAKLDIENGLVELCLRDLAAHRRMAVNYEAGALPLLSHALLATWENGRGRGLTVASYTTVGGIHGAVAQTAETVYQSLSAQQQALARALLLRMVIVGEDTADSRRPVPIAELGEDVEAAPVLELFVENRLVTVEQDTAEISHEALIRAWPRLRTWIEEDRARLLVAQQVGEAAARWERENRDPAALYRGARLAVAKEHARQPGAVAPTGLSHEFIQASLRHERRKTTRLYQTIAGLAALLLVATGAGAFALQQRGEVIKERNAAISRLIAGRADRIRDKDVALAAQLSLVAYRLTPTIEATSALLDATATPAATRLIGGPGVMQAVALTPDKRRLAAAGLDRTIRLWDITRPKKPVSLAPPLRGAEDTIYSLAFSPDGRILAAGSGDKTVHLWDLSDPREPAFMVRLIGPTALIYSVAFSPDGRTLAAGSGDFNVHLWDVAQPYQPRALGQPLAGAGSYIQAVTFSPDGKTLAAGSDDKTVRLWSLQDRERATPLGAPLTGPARTVFSVAFSPDGRTLAAGSADSQVYLWDIADPVRPAPRGQPIPGGGGWVNAVLFGPDSDTLAFASSSNAVRIWDLNTQRLTASLPHPGPVTSVAFGADKSVVSSAADGIARIWHRPWPTLGGHGGILNGVTFNRQGTMLAIAGTETQLWDAQSRTRRGSITNPSGVSTAIAVSPTGRVLAVGGRDGTIQQWDVSDAGRPSAIGPPIAAHAKLVETVAFSPDGRTLASGSDDNTLRFWDASDPANLRLLSTVDDFRAYVVTVAFSPDGKTLAAASIDNTVRLWDVARPDRPVALGPPVATLEHYALAVAFSPDGRTLAVGSADKTLRLFDVTDRAKPVMLGPPLGGPANYVYTLAFTPDGNALAAGSTDETVWLWDLRDRARPVTTAVLSVPVGAVYTVAFHPDGRTLAAGGTEKTVWLWNTDPLQAIDHICGHAGDAITVEEWERYVPGLAYQPPCP